MDRQNETYKRARLKGLHWLWSAIFASAVIGSAVAFQNCGQSLQDEQVGIARGASRFDAIVQGGLPKIIIEKEGGQGTVLSINPPGVIHCGIICQGNYPKDMELTLAATPAAGNAFDGWVVDGNATTCGSALQCKVKLTKDEMKITAKFKSTGPSTSPPPTPSTSVDGVQSLKIEKTGNGQVFSMNPIGVINCGSICEASLPSGTRVTVANAPTQGSAFEAWEVQGSPAECPDPNFCSVTLTQATVVRAKFRTYPVPSVNPSAGPPTPSVIPSRAPLFPKIRVDKVGSGTVMSLQPAGTINCGIICEGYYPPGSEIALAPVAASGFKFDGWTVNDSTTECPGTLSCVIKLQSDTKVIARFSPSGGPSETSPQIAPTFTGVGSGCNGCDCAWITGANFPLLKDLTLRMVAGNDAWDPSVDIAIEQINRGGTTALSMNIPDTKVTIGGQEKSWREIFSEVGLRFTVNNTSISNGWNTTPVAKCSP